MNTGLTVNSKTNTPNTDNSGKNFANTGNQNASANAVKEKQINHSSYPNPGVEMYKLMSRGVHAVSHTVWGASKAIAGETLKVGSVVAGIYLGERAFACSDHPTLGFLFTGFWVAATGSSMLIEKAPVLQDAALTWWTNGTTPKVIEAFGGMVAFAVNMSVVFFRSAGSAHFSQVVSYGTDGAKRVLKFLDDARPVRNIYFATTALGVLAGHAGEVVKLGKSIWNRTLSVSQATAKVVQYGFEWVKSIYNTKIYAEGIAIYPQAGRYGYIVDGLTLQNCLFTSVAAGCAKLAENWNDPKFADQNIYSYVTGQLDRNFIIDQLTDRAKLMLIATGSLLGATIFQTGCYDITDPLFACQMYLAAIALGMYVNPVMKYVARKVIPINVDPHLKTA